MQECPRCGFTQPPDRFCANCGINIEKYTPAPEPLLSKVCNSTGFLLTAVLGLIFALFSAIYVFKESTVPREQNIIETANYSHSTLSDSAEPQQQPAEELSQSNIKESSEESSYAINEKTLPKEAYAKIPAATSNIVEKIVATTPPKELKINFYEAPTALLLELSEKNQVILDNPNTKAFLIERASSFQDTLNQFTPIDMGLEHQINEKSFIHNFGTGFNEQEPLGLRISGRMKIEVDVTQTVVAMEYFLRDDNNSLSQNSFQVDFNLKKNQLIIIVGLLPNNSNLANEAISSRLQGTPLDILFSETFQAGESDFITVFQVK